MMRGMDKGASTQYAKNIVYIENREFGESL